MSLRNEILEGVSVFTALNPRTSGRDRYYDFLADRARQRDMAVEKAGADAIAARERGPANLVPTRASTAMPGTTAPSAFGDQPRVAFEPQLPGTYQNGGMVQRFEDGGMVEGESPQDRLVLEILMPPGSPAGRSMQRLAGRPQAASTTAVPDAGPSSEVMAGIGEQPPEGEELTAFKPAAPGTRAVDQRPPMPSGNVIAGAGEQPPQPPETSSRAGRGIKQLGTAVKEGVGALGRAISGLTPEDHARASEQMRLVEEMGRTQPGLFEQQTPEQQTESERRQADLQRRYDAAGAKANPTPPQGDNVALQTAPPGQGGFYGKPAGPQQETGGTPEAGRPSGPYPVQRGRNAVPAPGSPKVNGPPTTGNSGPGSGAGARPAPPLGSGGANMPSTAPKGSLTDQTRTRAFDPTDPNDAREAAERNVRMATGESRAVTPQDIQQTLAGAMQSAPSQGGQPPVVGQGAISRPVFQQFVQAHNQGGKLPPGQAALVGMVGKYRELLRQGRPQEAATMAWSVLQAANLEAASAAMEAGDFLKQGNQRAAVASLAQAIDYVPDGKIHRADPSGQFITTIDPNTGQPTARTPMTPQVILQLAMGLADGSMLWNALQQSASVLTKPDRNAEGRALTNELRRQQIEGAKLRNKKLASGGTGKAAPAPSGKAAEADAILGNFQPRNPTPARPTAQGGGEDGMPIDYDPGGGRDEEE